MKMVWTFPSNNQLVASLALLAAVLLLSTVALQYPLRTTYPMGGDAPAYIVKVQQLLAVSSPAELWRSAASGWYPAADLLFVPMRLLPLDWPMRFTWWAALGQIAVGLALGWLLYRLSSWREAAAGIAWWALTPIIATKHYEDGTIAQLWSYAFVFLFLERYHASARWSAACLLLLTFFTHPITGMALMMAVLIGLVPQWIVRRRLSAAAASTLRFLTITATLSILILVWLVIYRRGVFPRVVASAHSISPLDYVRSAFAPAFLIAPLGFAVVLEKLQRSLHTLLLLTAVTAVFLLLGSNNLLGVSIWMKRLSPLFVVLLCLMAAFGWPHVLRFFSSSRTLRAAVSISLFATLGLMTWQENSVIYAYYESPSRYARIHPDEIAATMWLRDGVPAGTTIYSTAVNRHTDWIRVLTPHHLVVLESDDWLNSLVSAVAHSPSPPNDSSYMVFFLRREAVPDHIRNNPEVFPVVYHTAGAVVVQIPLRKL